MTIQRVFKYFIVLGMSVLIPSTSLFALDPSIVEIRDSSLPTYSEEDMKRFSYHEEGKNALLLFNGGTTSTVGATTSINITVDSSDTLINTVSMHVLYDSTVLEFIDTDNRSSDFSFSFVEKHDVDSGLIVIHYLQPYPGVSDVSSVMNLQFKTIQKGDTSVIFSPKTRVLASDGYGTDVLAASDIYRLSIQ